VAARAGAVGLIRDHSAAVDPTVVPLGQRFSIKMPDGATACLRADDTTKSASGRRILIYTDDEDPRYQFSAPITLGPCP
jgi:3D (Asp-Asp-Asp) domain-containing protein